MSEIQIIFIGSGDAFASGGKLTTCFHVSSSDKSLLIDCGGAALVGLKKEEIDLNSIETIFISHFHGDHFGGLPFFILDAHLIQDRQKPLTIVGPEGLQERVVQLMEAMFKGSSSLPFKFELRFIELEDYKESVINEIKTTYYPVVHSPESNPHGLKITIQDKVVAYSGDTEWTDALIDLARGSDLFIVECFNFSGDLRFHMNYQLLAEKSKLLESRKVMLTHLGPDMLEQQELQFDVCQDGQSLIIG